MHTKKTRIRKASKPKRSRKKENNHNRVHKGEAISCELKAIMTTPPERMSKEEEKVSGQIKKIGDLTYTSINNKPVHKPNLATIDLCKLLI